MTDSRSGSRNRFECTTTAAGALGKLGGEPRVEREVQAAFEREHRSGKPVLFPIRVDEAVMEATQAWAADIRRTRHIGEFGNWRDHESYKKALERLLRDLKNSG